MSDLARACQAPHFIYNVVRSPLARLVYDDDSVHLANLAGAGTATLFLILASEAGQIQRVYCQHCLAERRGVRHRPDEDAEELVIWSGSEKGIESMTS